MFSPGVSTPWSVPPRATSRHETAFQKHSIERAPAQRMTPRRGRARIPRVSSLSAQSILVTGASRGIGRAIALKLSAEGARVLISGRDQTALDELSALGLIPFAGDLTSVSTRHAILGAAGEGLDGLIHSAGVCTLGPLADTTERAFDLNLEVNLKVPYLLTSALLPALRKKRGRVVFINSGAGKVAKAGWSAYAASKHGLKALADSLREEESGHGVSVTSVYPGRTATEMQASVRSQEGKDYDPSLYVRPDDVAEAVVLAFRTAPPSVLEEVSIRPL